MLLAMERTASTFRGQSGSADREVVRRARDATYCCDNWRRSSRPPVGHLRWRAHQVSPDGTVRTYAYKLVPYALYVAARLALGILNVYVLHIYRVRYILIWSGRSDDGCRLDRLTRRTVVHSMTIALYNFAPPPPPPQVLRS